MVPQSKSVEQFAESVAVHLGRSPNEPGVSRLMSALTDDQKADACVEAFRPLAEMGNRTVFVAPHPLEGITDGQMGLMIDKAATVAWLVSLFEGNAVGSPESVVVRAELWGDVPMGGMPTAEQITQVIHRAAVRLADATAGGAL